MLNIQKVQFSLLVKASMVKACSSLFRQNSRLMRTSFPIRADINKNSIDQFGIDSKLNSKYNV